LYKEKKSESIAGQETVERVLVDKINLEEVEPISNMTFNQLL